MRVHVESTYPAPVTPEAVVAARVDEEFLNRLCVTTGALEHSVESEVGPDGAGWTRTRRSMPTTEVPDFARSFVGETLPVVEEVHWTSPDPGGRRSGTIELRIEGMPVTFRGTIVLVDAGSRGTTETVDGELKAKIPLMGGRVERSLEPVIRLGVDAQTVAVKEWLSQ